MRKFGVFGMAALLAGCSLASLGADVPVAKNAAADFHRQLNAGKFVELYTAAGSEMHGATTQQQWVQILDAVHRKLGNFKSAPEPGWNDQMTTGGHFITLTYQSAYERGAATETMSYKIENGKALLVGYNINSNALITG